MHITVFGAGALGRTYGVRLALSGHTVAFAVRERRLAEDFPFAIQQVNGPKLRDVLEKPTRVRGVPSETDIVIVTVRFDQLLSTQGPDALLPLLQEGPRVPVVVLTPLLGKQHTELTKALGTRIVPAMPSVAAYIDDDGTTRYWLTSLASTFLDDPGQGEEMAEKRGELDLLARALTRAGISTQLEKGVLPLNAATTTLMYPFIAAIGIAGTVDAVLSNKDLFATVLDAAKETEALARRIGKTPPWTGVLLKFVGPFTLKPGIALARRLAPETLTFVEQHFGPKLRDQHLIMGETLIALGVDESLPTKALPRLVNWIRNAV